LPRNTRLPDAARAAAARAFVFFAVTVVAAMVAALGVIAGARVWVAAVLGGALSLLACGWSLPEVMIERQIDVERFERATGHYELGPISGAKPQGLPPELRPRREFKPYVPPRGPGSARPNGRQNPAARP
jgi:hypothetical protein